MHNIIKINKMCTERDYIICNITFSTYIFISINDRVGFVWKFKVNIFLRMNR